MSKKNVRIGTNDEKKEHPVRKALIIIISILVVAIAIGVVVFLTSYHTYKTTIVPPTCTQNGYTQQKCIYCNKIIRTNYTPATGHNFSQTEIVKEATSTTFGVSQDICSICGKKLENDIEPTSDLRKIYISGNVYETTNRQTTLDVGYSYDGERIDSVANISYIDSSSTRIYKHNMALSFLNENGDPQKLELLNGAKTDRYILYGNMFDCFNVRGPSAQKLFTSARLNSSTSINEEVKKMYEQEPNSEPCLVFTNKVFIGVFRLEKQVDEDTFFLDEKSNQAIMKSEYFANDTKFEVETSETGSGQFRVTYSSRENPTWAYKSFNELIKCVIEYDGDEFKEKIKEHLDTDAMIDYMLTVYLSAAGSNTVDNAIYATYDGKIWTPAISNIGLSFGLNSKGEIGDLENTLIPKKEGDTIDDDTSNQLWQKMLESFYPEIKARYDVLKDTTFSLSNIQSVFNDYYEQVPKSIYKNDIKLYKNVDSSYDLDEQIESFMEKRFSALDEFFK